MIRRGVSSGSAMMRAEAKRAGLMDAPGPGELIRECEADAIALVVREVEVVLRERARHPRWDPEE